MTYVVKFWQPLTGLIIGLIVVLLFALLKTRWKNTPIKWIAEHIYRNQIMAEKSAEGLWNVIISFLFTIGGLWIIMSLLYLGVL